MKHLLILLVLSAASAVQALSVSWNGKINWGNAASDVKKMAVFVLPCSAKEAADKLSKISFTITSDNRLTTPDTTDESIQTYINDNNLTMTYQKSWAQVLGTDNTCKLMSGYKDDAIKNRLGKDAYSMIFVGFDKDKKILNGKTQMSVYELNDTQVTALNAAKDNLDTTVKLGAVTPAVLPEPTVLALLALGLAGLTLRRRS